MHKLPFAHRIKKPFTYTPSNLTDVGATIRKARKALEDAKPKPKATNVQPLRKKEKQAA